MTAPRQLWVHFGSLGIAQDLTSGDSTSRFASPLSLRVYGFRSYIC
jgi:hypothetical protein